MLKNQKESVTLSAVSVFTQGEEEFVIAEFTAHIPDNGISGGVTQHIRDIELFEVNRTEVRRDQNAFQNEVWEIEDRMLNEATTE